MQVYGVQRVASPISIGRFFSDQSYINNRVTLIIEHMKAPVTARNAAAPMAIATSESIAI